MANSDKLRATMAAHGVKTFVAELSQALSITRPTASAKLSGRVAFRDNEIAILAERYNMTPAEVVDVFIN